ncbi:protein kinase C theta type-like [Eleutherodactylus coqui]|uniref:protein kinase C theta type-like n=1 Tax=Eleutherodactylus coqui TaxID=57060 RepID=UPI003461FDDF
MSMRSQQRAPARTPGHQTPDFTSVASPAYRHWVKEASERCDADSLCMDPAVVLASFPGRNTFTAIKIVDRGSGADMILRERRILLKAQDCPFICHLYAAQQSANKAYFIMEYLSGGSLRAMIRMCGRLDISSVRFYTAEIVCGLQFLHQRNIVHRDIKLDNIMVDRDGHIRLIDLGLAQDGVTSSNKICGRTGV